MDWPGNSADMNPIENIWKMLKDKMNEETVSTNKRQLIEKLLDVWFHDQQLMEKTMIKTPKRQNDDTADTIRYDTIEEINVDSKAEYTA